MKYLNKEKLLKIIQGSQQMHQHSKIHKAYKLYKLTADTCDIYEVTRFKINKVTYISFKLRYNDIEDTWVTKLKSKEGIND